MPDYPLWRNRPAIRADVPRKDYIRYNISLRQFYAYAIAPHFVADRRDLTWVESGPFVVM